MHCIFLFIPPFSNLHKKGDKCQIYSCKDLIHLIPYLLFPHCPICTVHSTHWYSVQCTLHSIHSTVYIRQCTLHNIQSTEYSVKCKVHSVQCTVHNIILYILPKASTSVPCHRMYRRFFSSSLLYIGLFFSIHNHSELYTNQ